MSELKPLREKVYFQLVGDDLLETAKEMEIDEKSIKSEDLEFVADKISDGLEWSDVCHEAWLIWKERKERGEI